MTALSERRTHPESQLTDAQIQTLKIARFSKRDPRVASISSRCALCRDFLTHTKKKEKKGKTFPADAETDTEPAVGSWPAEPEECGAGEKGSFVSLRLSPLPMNYYDTLKMSPFI